MSKTERRDHTGLHSNPCSASEMKTLIGSQEHVLIKVFIEHCFYQQAERFEGSFEI